MVKTLNESPSEKEGKYTQTLTDKDGKTSLNESPSEKEGKSATCAPSGVRALSLNESPSEKEGKSQVSYLPRGDSVPSMKVPPKRKGNL